MPRTADASSFTRFQKLNAQSLNPTLNLTQSSVVPATLTLNGTIGATVKASAVAAAAAPSTAVTATSKFTSLGKKRG